MIRDFHRIKSINHSVLNSYMNVSEIARIAFYNAHRLLWCLDLIVISLKCTFVYRYFVLFVYPLILVLTKGANELIFWCVHRTPYQFIDVLAWILDLQSLRGPYVDYSLLRSQSLFRQYCIVLYVTASVIQAINLIDAKFTKRMFSKAHFSFYLCCFIARHFASLAWPTFSTSCLYCHWNASKCNVLYTYIRFLLQGLEEIGYYIIPFFQIFNWAVME